MSRASLLAPLALALAVGSAAAQPAGQVAYVSNFTGGQVLSIDRSTGAATVVLSRTLVADSAFSPQDMTVGPDGRLYICDSLNGRVWRLTTSQPVVASVNPAVIASFDAGVYPEGPSFSGSDDLYVNTRGSGTAATGGSGAAGLWVIPGAATPGAPTPIAPQMVIPAFGASGEGTTFAAPGHLLAVDSPGRTVRSLKPLRGGFPHYGSATATLISSNLNAPVGIAVNACGDVLVSSDNAIRRFPVAKNPATGELSAPSGNTYVTFPRGDVVTFFERDAANVVWVNTNSSNAGGKVWRIAPATPAGGDPIASCTSGVLPAEPLVALKKLSQGSNPILTNAQLQAVGLAIPATDYTAAAKTFSPAAPGQTWNFGHYSVRLEYREVYTAFAQSFTALMTRPADVAFATGTFTAGTESMRFPSLGGFVGEFRTRSPSPGCTSFAQCGAPVAGTDFAPGSTDEPAFRLLFFYNDPIQGFRNSGVAHASNDTPSGVYQDNYSSDVWIGEDGIRAGSGNNFGSKYVLFEEPFEAGLAFPLTVTLNQPALDGHPLFKLGQNFTVSLTVTDANGRPAPGLAIRLSALRFRPEPFVFETVRATNGSAQLNFLNDNGNGRYSLGVDTGLFQGGPGIYQVTLFGSGFPPFEFRAQFEK